MRIATEHLIQQGHKNIAMLIGPLSEQTGRERARGYYEAMEEAGLEIQKRLCVDWRLYKTVRRNSRETASLLIPPSYSRGLCQRFNGNGLSNRLLPPSAYEFHKILPLSVSTTLITLPLVLPQLTSVDMMQ